MSARFRLIHFMPDPFGGSTFTVAALVEANSRVQVTRAPHIPGPHCLGGRSAWTVVMMALEALERGTGFDVLPAAVGPHFLLDKAVAIPDAVYDAADWVTRVILPRNPVVEDDVQTPHAPSRQVQGQAFFKNWGVAKYVKPKFDGIAFHLNANTVHPISHYVTGRQNLLLMEPVVGTRADLTKELRDISETFLAWQKIFESRPLGRQPEYFAYVLGGSHRGAAQLASEILEESRASVVNVDIPNSCMQFVEHIKHVGRSVESGTLPWH